MSVSYLGREKWQEGHRIDPCQDTLTLIRAIMPLWDRRPAGTPLKVGIVFADLVHERNVPRPLFERDNRLLDLAKAMDAANAGAVGTRSTSAACTAKATRSRPRSRSERCRTWS